MSNRTPLASIEESGWAFQVFAPYDDISNFGEEVLEEMRAGARERMRRAQDLVVKEVKITLGRYMDRPSRANEPPRKLMGDLQESWRRGSLTWQKNQTILTGRVQAGTRGKHNKYAGPLEFGALRALGFGPRPYYRPTLARIEQKLGDIIEGVE